MLCHYWYCYILVNIQDFFYQNSSFVIGWKGKANGKKLVIGWKSRANEKELVIGWKGKAIEKALLLVESVRQMKKCQLLVERVKQMKKCQLLVEQFRQMLKCHSWILNFLLTGIWLQDGAGPCSWHCEWSYTGLKSTTIQMDQWIQSVPRWSSTSLLLPIHTDTPSTVTIVTKPVTML